LSLNAEPVSINDCSSHDHSRHIEARLSRINQVRCDGYKFALPAGHYAGFVIRNCILPVPSRFWHAGRAHRPISADFYPQPYALERGFRIANICDVHLHDYGFAGPELSGKNFPHSYLGTVSGKEFLRGELGGLCGGKKGGIAGDPCVASEIRCRPIEAVGDVGQHPGNKTKDESADRHAVGRKPFPKGFVLLYIAGATGLLVGCLLVGGFAMTTPRFRRTQSQESRPKRSKEWQAASASLDGPPSA